MKNGPFCILALPKVAEQEGFPEIAKPLIEFRV
jgi:hypothetical protein